MTQATSTGHRGEAMSSRLLDMLQGIPVFGGIAEGALQHILDSASTVTTRKDDFFFREAERAQSMFVLVEGRVAVIKSIEGHEYELSRMGPGDCFGELELLDLCPRAASVRALEDCRAIEISATLLREIYKIDPTSFAMIQMNMGREVSRRLRKLDADMLKVRLRGGVDSTGGSRTGEGGAAREIVCPVCAKHIHMTEERCEVWHADAQHTVCCPVCAERFRQDPELYLVVSRCGKSQTETQEPTER